MQNVLRKYSVAQEMWSNPQQMAKWTSHWLKQKIRLKVLKEPS